MANALPASALSPLTSSPGRLLLVRLLALVVALASGFSAGCRSAQPVVATAAPGSRTFLERGEASWYGPGFHGRRTACGEIFDGRAATAAHRTLPFQTLVEVVNLNNGRAVTVRINDRGPFIKNRIIDLSRSAAESLGIVGPGVAPVEIYLLQAAPVPTGETYTVQVGAFLEAERAEALAGELKRRFDGTAVRSDGTWNRVQVDLLPTREAAEILRQALQQLGYGAVVVPLRSASASSQEIH